MESRKKIEARHYDRLAQESAKHNLSGRERADVEKLRHEIFSSYQFCEKWMKENIRKGHAVLDYGCGNGIHSILPATLGAKVTGIDLSQESLKIARNFAKEKGVQNLTTFLEMDCEKLSFPDNSFDIIFDGGTLSSLDMKKAIPEIARVLKPKGTLIAIETLGHNPLTNIKRKVNKLLGKRTGWAIDHIVKVNDFALIQRYFGKMKIHYFNLLSLFAFPFLSFSGGVTLLHILEKMDSYLLKIPFLQKYAFKVVFIASNPKKS